MQIGFLVSKQLCFDHRRYLNPPWIQRRWTIHPFCVFPTLHAGFEASHLRWNVMKFGDGEGCNVWKLFCLLGKLWKGKEKLFGYWESNGCLAGRIYVVDYFWWKMYRKFFGLKKKKKKKLNSFFFFLWFGVRFFRAFLYFSYFW